MKKIETSYLNCLLFVIQDYVSISLKIQRHSVYENYVVKYSSSSIKINECLLSTCQGIGKSVEDACEDYFNKLIEKIIVFNEMDKTSREELNFNDGVKKYNQSILDIYKNLSNQEVFEQVCKELNQ